MSTAEAFEASLHALDPEAHDFVIKLDSLIAECGEQLGAKLLPAIFRFFEAHPANDMGAPGTLVHFAEHFYPAYKELLLGSLARRPSYNGVLMVNRILNSNQSESERIEYLGALEAVAGSSVAEVGVRGQAKHFIDYQHARR